MKGSKKLFLFSTVFIMALLMLLNARAFAQTLPGGTLDPNTIPKYVIPLVIPPVMNTNVAGPDNYDIAVRQFQQQILPGGIWDTVADPADIYPNFPATTIWSYGPAVDPLPDSTGLGGAVGVAPAPNSQFNYPAYTVETMSNIPVNVKWINDLVMDPIAQMRAIYEQFGLENFDQAEGPMRAFLADRSDHVVSSYRMPKAVTKRIADRLQPFIDRYGYREAVDKALAEQEPERHAQEVEKAPP